MTAARKRSSISSSIVRQRTRSSLSRMKRRCFSMHSSAAPMGPRTKQPSSRIESMRHLVLLLAACGIAQLTCSRIDAQGVTLTLLAAKADVANAGSADDVDPYQWLAEVHNLG